LHPAAIEYVVVQDGNILSASEDGGPRTVNGLRKRIPRARRTQSRPAEPVSSPADKPAPVRDTPEAVRDRLNALRGGIQRGSAETAGSK
jgi:hypothetical protein